jgi:hypothetical protein
VRAIIETVPASRRYRASIALLAITVAYVICGATAAHATTLPGGAVVCVGPRVDAGAFARAVASRYHVVLQRVVAADIDRDGDLDVLSTTERGFLIWVNDGTGRLTSQTPKHRPFIDGTAPPDTWNGAPTGDEETIQNDVRSLRLPSARAHAPPSSVRPTASSADFWLYAAAPNTRSAPRAPPSEF